MIHNGFVFAVLFVFAGSGFCGDWAQWHGALRDNISVETGLLDEWPKGGPEMLWSVEGIGKGYSSVSVSEGFVYVTGMAGRDKGMLSKISVEGKLIWRKGYGKEWYRSYAGSRSTPTITGGFAYIMTGQGEVVCMDIETGEKVWSVNTFDKYGGRLPYWGLAESVVVDGSKVYCQAGGKNASVAALRKTDGSVVWVTKELSEKASFCSPIIVDHHGKKQLITVLAESVVGIDISNGKVLWKMAKKVFSNPDGDRRGLDNSTNTPIYKDGFVFVSSGYDQGAAKIRISEDSREASLVWKNYELDNHHGGIVLVEGKLYGAGWDGNTKGDWLCVDWETGKTLYKHSWDKNKGSLTYAEGMLYCYAEKTGKMALVKADPSKFDIVSTFEITKGEDEHWAHPVISNGRLYIRHGDVLMVYDISK